MLNILGEGVQMPATLSRKPLFSMAILGFSASLVIGGGSPAYAETPKATTPACKTAAQFLGFLNSQNAKGIGELFANPSDIVGPDGKKHTDPADFVEMEEKGFKSMGRPWRFEIVHLAPYEKDGCLMEFSVSEKDGVPFVPGAVDRFDVNKDGKIVKFIPYFAASWVNRAQENMAKVKAAQDAAKAEQK